MRIEDSSERLDVMNSDIGASVLSDVSMNGARIENAAAAGLRVLNVNASGASFDDVDLTGARFHNTRLENAEITESCMSGMKINGILVTDLLNAYEAAAAAGGK